MALFQRGNESGSLLKRLEAGNFKGPEEKRKLLAALAQEVDHLDPETTVRLLCGNDSDLGRFALDRIGPQADPRLLGLFLARLQRTPRGKWRPLLLAVLRLNAVDLPERLVPLLRSRKTEARTAALEVIAADENRGRYFALLKGALRDEEPELRLRAVRVLGLDAQDATVRDLLRELLFSQDEPLRDASLDALVRKPHPDLIEDFFDLLPNVSARQQDGIFRALRRLLSAEGGITEAVLDRILPLLAADDKRIRSAAAKLLASIPDKLNLLRRFFRYAKGIAFWLRDRAFEAISGVADDMPEAILALLRDEDLDVVVGATAMAGKSTDPRLVKGLAEVLDRNYEWWIKIPALERLAEFPQQEVAPLIVAQLEDPELRTAALACLGRRAEPETLPEVLRFCDHPKASLRKAVYKALAGFRDSSVDRALEHAAREEKDYDCKMIALELLEERGTQGAATAEAIRKAIQAATSDVMSGPALDML